MTQRPFNFFDSLSSLNPSSLKNLSGHLRVLIETKLWAKVLLGMLLGIILGILLSNSGPLSHLTTPYTKNIDSILGWMALPAKLFLKIIKMVIIPLIFSSIIRGLASTNDVTQMQKLGFKFSLFVLITTIAASIFGIVLTELIRPGDGLNLGTPLGSTAAQASDLGSVFRISPDTFLDILPVNPLASFVEGQMLDVVILSLIAGVAFLSIEKEQAKSVMNILEIIQQVCMKIISWAMRIAPIAVFGMMTQVTFSTGIKSLGNMALYVATCFIGFVGFIFFYGILLKVFKKVSFREFVTKMSTPLLLAFSTSSSAATMPVTMKTAEEDLAIEPALARFLIPLGTTVNMAGSAIWHTSAVIFLGQVYGIELTVPQISIVVATSIASAIGSPGVPGVGVGILSTVLVRVGVPLEGISLIMGVDRIIDMGCTTVNVAGDLTASKLFSRS